MNITIPESQRQEFECFCNDNNIDPLSLKGLATWEGWQAAYLANATVSLAAAPTPPAPAPEVEPVAVSINGKLAHLPYVETLPHGTKLYTHPDNDGLRKAAEEAYVQMSICGVLDETAYERALHNLRAELDKGK